MKREIAAIIGAIAVIVILVGLISYGVINVSDVSAALAYTLVAAIFGLLFWGFAPRIKRFIRGDSEHADALEPSQKRTGWLSKPKRTAFWTIMCTMVIIGLILLVVGIILPFPEITSPNPILYVSKVLTAGIGTAFLLVSSIFIAMEFYFAWDFRKIHKIKCVKSCADFDEVFTRMKDVSAPELKKDMLHLLSSRLSVLCRSCSWSEAKDRVGRILELVPEDFSSKPTLYLQFLRTLIQSYGDDVTGTISKKWLKDMENLYSNPKSYLFLVDVLYILQELKGYDFSYMEKLVDDATLWSKYRFDMLADHIGFSELKKRNQQAHELITKYLLRKIDDATRDKNDEIKMRLCYLYNKAVA